MIKFLNKFKKLLSVISYQLLVAKRSERGFLTTGLLIAIAVGIAVLGLGGGTVWYVKYQSAKKAEEEEKRLQTRVIAPAELPPSEKAPQVPIIFLTASPDIIKYDGTDKAVLLKAAIGGNPTSCLYNWDKNLSSAESKEYKITIPGAIQTHQIYTITCEGEGGSVSKSATVTISAAEPPTITLIADKNQVDYKDSATLSWSSRDATNCELKDIASKSLSQSPSGVKTLSSLTKSNAYILTCSGPGGWASKFTSVTVSAPASTTQTTSAVKPGTPTNKTPTLSLTASNQSVAYNSSITLSWSSSNISYCSASSTPYGAWSGIQSVSGTKEIANLVESKTFTLNCEGEYGTISQSISVAVSAAPVPEISFSAEPPTISYNGSSSLKWSATNTKSCSASGAWSGSKSMSGTEEVKNLTYNKTYTLTCVGTSGESISKSASITVGTAPIPQITFSAEPTTVSYNGSSGLTWSATDAKSCSASGAWSGSKSTSGSEEVKNLTYNKTYTLTCTGIGGNASKSISVAVSYTYAWVESAWSSCNVPCGGGAQTRTATCKKSDGQNAAESNCPSPKPATSQACNTTACIVDDRNFSGVSRHGSAELTAPCGYRTWQILSVTRSPKPNLGAGTIFAANSGEKEIYFDGCDDDSYLYLNYNGSACKLYHRARTDNDCGYGGDNWNYTVRFTQ